jgi:D-alanyl-D-alanine carboxypeptidase (penicillin-binding protein 5/6)
MTALVILRAHPLKVGMPGPTITVSAADVSEYQSELAAGDSVVRVATGETLSELQVLEGLLLPSGDNLSVLLADWQSGSEAAFVQQMDRLAASLHLSQTHFSDSSGLDQGSVSSARDLVTLATVAMKIPVFASIVALPTVTLPVAGVVHNYNPLLGQDGVIGIKTGWTAAAMGCLVFAAEVSVAGTPRQLIGAVLGQPGGPESGLVAAGRVAAALLSSGQGELHEFRLPVLGSRVGRVASSWAEPVAVRASQAISLIGAAGARLALRLRFDRLRSPLHAGEQAGSLTVTTPGGFSYREPVEMTRKLAAPSWWWRLTRSL